MTSLAALARCVSGLGRRGVSMYCVCYEPGCGHAVTQIDRPPQSTYRTSSVHSKPSGHQQRPATYQTPNINVSTYGDLVMQDRSTAFRLARAKNNCRSNTWTERDTPCKHACTYFSVRMNSARSRAQRTPTASSRSNPGYRERHRERSGIEWCLYHPSCDFPREPDAAA